jgi:hypothetical protein
MYRLHRAGGRVKTAGLGLDDLYPVEGARYADEATPEAAGELRAVLRDMQNRPPLRLLAAFFPQERAAIRQHLQRAGLYRPFLKTDQGPPGTFLPFVTGVDAELRRYRIVKREGVAVPEGHMRETLADDSVAGDLAGRIRSTYREQRLGDCAAALGELGERVGYDGREAGVGRGLFFFCNASATDAPITVPEHVCERVERIVNEVMERAEGKAARVRALYRDGTPLAEALATTETADPVPSPLYFQADVYVTLDGKIEVERIQLPDVGIFLTELDSVGHTILPQVQETVQRLRDRTTELLATLSSPTYLVTRPEVLETREDTLEQLEIQAFQKMAAVAGIDLRVATPADVAGLPAGAQLLLLNVDLAAPASEPLLARVARGEVACTPDPFLKLMGPELTTMRRTPVAGNQLQRLMDAIRPGRQMNPSSCHEMHRGIERIYRHGKYESDILHVEVPGEGTPVPTLRHSVHSFTSLYNTCNRNGFPDLVIREVPINRGNAIVHGDHGPHVSAFRFYFTRE